MQVDELPLSRPKKNIGRDFADGGKTPALIDSKGVVPCTDLYTALVVMDSPLGHRTSTEKQSCPTQDAL